MKCSHNSIEIILCNAAVLKICLYIRESAAFEECNYLIFKIKNPKILNR